MSNGASPLPGLPVGGPAPQRIIAAVSIQFIAEGRGVTPQILAFVPPPALRPVAELLEQMAKQLRQQASPILTPP